MSEEEETYTEEDYNISQEEIDELMEYLRENAPTILDVLIVYGQEEESEDGLDFDIL